MLKWFVRTLAGVMVASLLASPFALAASTSPTPATPGQGLEISPPVFELNANPGQSVNIQVKIRNITQTTLEVTGAVNDFGAGPQEDGSPQLLFNEVGTTRYSLKTWVTGVQNILLAPQQLETANVDISVPQNAEPGGHYGVVRFTGVPPSLKGEGVALSASVGALILLRVNGDVIDQLNLAEFAAGTQTGVDTWNTQDFFEHGPVNFLVRLQDTGTVHEQPVGTITVKNFFGGTVGTVQVNSKSGNILPGSYRRFVQSLPNKELFGHYTATLALRYNGTKTLSGTFGFWVIPWILILLVLIGAIVIFYLLKIGIKKYNEHIIALARRR